MGPVMVPLDTHAAIAYGVRAGLLELLPEERSGPVRIALRGSDVLGVGCTVAPARDDDEPDDAQRVLYGWYLGMPLVHKVSVPGYYGGTAPDEPDPALPAMRCYLTGTVDEAAPSSPVREVPTPDGTRTLPSHQNTTDKHPGHGRTTTSASSSCGARRRPRTPSGCGPHHRTRSRPSRSPTRCAWTVAGRA